MSIPISQEVDLLYKKLFGVSKTDMPENKSPSNESIASPALNRGDTAWTQADQIPGIAAATVGIVQAYTGAFAVECTPDITSVPISGVNQTWLTGLTNWIPSEFGATYFVQAWADTAGAANPTLTGTQLFADGSSGVGEWFFDYQAGLLNFIGETIPAALTASKVVYIVGYRYIGLTGVTNLPSGTAIGELSFSNTTISSTATLEPVTIQVIDTANSATYDWTFDATGNLVLPTNTAAINYANGLPYGGGGNANVISIPAIYFDVTADGNNQTFSNSFLASYSSNTDITLFYNGALLDSPYYTLSGDTITVNTDLVTGDSIDIIRQFASNVVVSTYSNVNVHSYLESASVGNIIPAGNNLASLGNATNQFLDLWVSNATIYFDGLPLSVNSNAEITFNGEPLAIIDGTQTITTTGNVDAGNIVVTGDITSNSFAGNTGNFTGNVTVAGVLTNNYYYANGSPISFDGTYSNANVANYLPTYTGNLPLVDSLVASTLAGDGSLITNITGGYVVGDVANAAYSVLAGSAATVYDNAQPNINSVGTLTSLVSSGNITIQAGGFFLGDGGLLSNISVGTNYSNANVANYLPTYTGNLDNVNIVTANVISSNATIIANSVTLGTTVTPVSISQWTQQTVSSATPVVLMTILAATVTHIDFNVVATDATGSSRQVSKLMAISYNGTVDYNEYGSLLIGTTVGDFTVTTNGTNIFLNVIPTNSNSIDYNVVAMVYY